MTREMTTDDLLARYNAGERDFAGIELIRILERDGIGSTIEGLEGANLRSINLRGANLGFVYLVGTDLTNANLFGAYLGGASLFKAILRDANFFSVNLQWVQLSGADLRGADLGHANLSNAIFIGANLTTTYWESTIMADANFRDSTTSTFDLCRSGNLIWNTTMPDGTVETGPYYGGQ